MQFKTLCKTLWNEKNKQWLVSLWLIWHLFSRSALYHTEPAAPCLFPSCRRRWRSCICTKTKAGSQTEHSFPHMDKAQTQTHFLDKAVSDSCWTDTIYWPLILEGQQRTHLCFKHGCVMFFIWSLSLLFYWLSGSETWIFLLRNTSYCFELVPWFSGAKPPYFLIYANLWAGFSWSYNIYTCRVGN